MPKIQIAKQIFLSNLQTMKLILDLGEYKLDEKSFKYYKKQVMDIVFNSLKKLFKQMEAEKLVEKCPKNCSLRKGYSDCECGGSGYINYEKI